MEKIEVQSESLYTVENYNMDIERQSEPLYTAAKADTEVQSEPSYRAESDNDMAIAESPKCVPLYTAAMKGDWDAAKGFENHMLTSKISEEGETILHIAAIGEKLEFVKKLVDHINGDSDFLKTENNEGNTALCYAATTGVVGIARVMLEVHEPNEQGYYWLANQGKVKPLTIAADSGRCEMVQYLFNKTDLGEWTETSTDRTDLFTNCIRFGLWDKAFEMLGKFEELVATERSRNGETGLDVLARYPSLFLPETESGCWRAFLAGFGTRNNNNVTVPGKKAVDMVRKLYDYTKNSESQTKFAEIRRPLRAAAIEGNDDFIIELIRCDPDLLWKFNTKLGTIFHIAISYRQEKIFSLLYDNLGSIKDLLANRQVLGKRNMLHLAAELAPPNRLSIVAGAALQMRRELLWFKEVKKIVKPSFRVAKNSEEKTPQMVFDETHKDLMSEGVKWMKETSKSSMVVAALIATVMFTTAFTVPGGFNNSDGVPIFKKRRWFFIFALADAFALFCSSTSILVFHSVMTSRYTEKDFLESLPFRLMVGVTSLFASVAAMMVTFCATFLLYYPRENVPWIYGLFALFACVPTLYVLLKYPLLVDLIRSNRDSRSMFKPRKKLFP